MAASDPSFQRKPLSRKNSRILLTLLFVCTLLLAFLSALGIKAAGENEEFQRAMEELNTSTMPPTDQQLHADSTIGSLSAPDSTH